MLWSESALAGAGGCGTTLASCTLGADSSILEEMQVLWAHTYAKDNISSTSRDTALLRVRV